MWDSVVSVTASPGTKVAADRSRRFGCSVCPFPRKKFRVCCFWGGGIVSLPLLPKIERKGGWVASFTPQGPLPPPKRGLGELNQLSKAKPPGAEGSGTSEYLVGWGRY